MKDYLLTIKEPFINMTISDFFNYMSVAKNKQNYLLQNNCCYLNGNIIKCDEQFKENDVLMLDLAAYESMIYQSIDEPLTIIYEDDYMIIINKPSGYIVYDLENKKESICNLLAAYYEMTYPGTPIIPIHRLDAETTGCLLFAKDVITAAYLSHAFETDTITKKYLAIVEGEMPNNGVISLNIGSDRHVNGKMVCCKNGKPAETSFSLVKKVGNYNLISLVLKTGRTHQIRVHLASYGHPIVGDTLYGSKNKKSRVLLHCNELTFNHPYKNKQLTITINIPEDMKKIL